MALDNWFQNWHTPFIQQAFHQPIKNYSYDHEFNPVSTTPNPGRLLPLMLSLNLMKPQEGKSNRQRPDGLYGPPSQINEGYKYSDNQAYSDFVTPELGLGSGFPSALTYSQSPAKPIYNQYISSEFKIPAAPIANPDFPSFPDSFQEKSNAWNKNTNRTFEEAYNLKPLELTGTFKTWYRWKSLDFQYPSELERTKAIASGEFIIENNLPLGIEVYKHRIFLSMPKWKEGVPATVAYLPRVPREESPKLMPYPSWAWHSEKSCDLITSVFRMQIDQCGRLWILDSGKISIITDEAKQHCPPKLLIFDLETDELIEKYVFPKDFIKEDSLYSNIVVDIRDGDCHNAYAYMVDVWRYGLVVFRLADHKAWRITNHFFYPDPLSAVYQLHHLKFEWTDGIFGLALSPVNHFDEDRILYFHPMSSFREFHVNTSYLREEVTDEQREGAIKILGQSRGPSGHVSSSVIDKNGIMYYNLVTRDSIGCWDSRKPYKRENLGVIAKSKETLVFPNDMRLDKENRQSIWIVSNRLPYYLVEGLDLSRINFRVMSAYTDESIKGTICDPNVHRPNTYLEYSNEIDCY